MSKTVKQCSASSMVMPSPCAGDAPLWIQVQRVRQLHTAKAAAPASGRLTPSPHCMMNMV
jgi:hypothetical protein